MDRKEVKVDKLPNKTWSLGDLISLGLRCGVDFGQNSDEIGYLLRQLTIDEALHSLYNQVEFIEFQDPVEEALARKSRPIDFSDVNVDTEWKATVIYRGNSFMTKFFMGKAQVFIPGMPYRFSREYMDFVESLMQDPDFDVKWGAAEEDSVMVALRRARENFDAPIDAPSDQAYGLVFLDGGQ